MLKPKSPALTFAPLAWLKLRMFLHADHVEVGFFGISDEKDLLYVTDLAVLKQSVSMVTVAFDDTAVADHFDHCADQGIGPARCGRIWVHTHPGSSPMPSTTDEETLARVFGECDWSVMAIVARDGSSYARLTFKAGPGGSVVLPIRVDWERFPKDLLDHEGALDGLFSTWIDEYGAKVFPEVEPEWGIGRGTFHQPGIELRDELDALYDQQWFEEDFASLHDLALEGVTSWR